MHSVTDRQTDDMMMTIADCVRSAKKNQPHLWVESMVGGRVSLGGVFCRRRLPLLYKLGQLPHNLHFLLKIVPVANK